MNQKGSLDFSSLVSSYPLGCLNYSLSDNVIPWGESTDNSILHRYDYRFNSNFITGLKRSKDEKQKHH